MAPGSASSESAASGLLANAGLKATALGIAVLLYAIVHGTQDAQQTFSVPLVATLPRTEMVLSDPLPAAIQVSLRGPRSKLRDLRAEGIAPLTLMLPAADATRFEVDGSQLDLPAGVRVERIEPSELSLKWEKPVARVVPVRVTLGNIPPGLVLEGPPIVDPPTVSVRGLARRLEVLQAVPTDGIDLTQALRGVGERKVGLVVPDGLLAVEPERVAVKFALRDATSSQAFAHVPVVVLGGAAKTQPSVVAVRFECPMEGRIPARAEDIVAFVRVPEAHVDLVDVQVEKGLCNVEVTPSRVIVRR
jgi:YbbR domain-containing protein